MYLIDEYLKTGGPPNDGDKILIGLVLSSGGFSGAGRGLSERGLLSRYKKARKELIHVVEIVDFLVRCAVHPIDGGRCNLKVAQKCNKERKNSNFERLTGIGKILRSQRLTFTRFIQNGHLTVRKIDTPKPIFQWISSFVRSQKRVDRFLGRAAFAMEVISRFSHQQRTKDLRGSHK
jgi:hypothetical protein